MKHRSSLTTFAGLLALFFATEAASAAAVKDLVKLDTHGELRLIGLGLVVGLHGTGDGDLAAPIVTAVLRNRPELRKSEEFKGSQSAAIATVIAQLPAWGACAGDCVDVTVHSPAAATTLKWGRLFPAALMKPQGDLPVAKAAGVIMIEDAEIPTSGVVKAGAILETDVVTANITDQTIRLRLNDGTATPELVTAIARSINDREGIALAAVIDRRTVSVKIPETEQSRPQPFIKRVMEVEVFRPK